MKTISRISVVLSRVMLPLLVAFTVAFASPARASAAQPEAPVIKLDNTYTGIYRAMADLVMESALKGDFPRAVLHAKILEVAFDRSEKEMKAKSRETWGQIDDAMDGFISPIVHYADAKPDEATIRAGYKEFVEKLKLAARK